jgi:hypothetical protein
MRGGGCFRGRTDGRIERVSVRSTPAGVLLQPRSADALRERVAALGYEVEIPRCSAGDAAAPAIGRGAAARNAESPDRRRAPSASS